MGTGQDGGYQVIGRWDRYLAGQVLLGHLVAAIALLALFGFLDLVEQLEDVGEDAFGVGDAAWQMILGLPRRLSQVLPFAALLGSLGALGGLANHQELVAIRAAGVSVGRLAAGVLMAGLVLVATLGVLEQVVAPVLDREALIARNRALGGGDAASQDWWIMDGNLILHIAEMRHGRVPFGVEIMERSEHSSLKRFIHAGWADVLEPRRWRLHEVTVKVFGEERTARMEFMDWRPPAGLALISRLQLAPESLAPLTLYRYIAYLDRAGRPAAQYRLVFWQKLAAAVNIVAMTLLALAFVFGSPRTGVGARLLLGGLTSILFFLAVQLAGSFGLVSGLPPALAALSPAIVMLAAALQLLAFQGRV